MVKELCYFSLELQRYSLIEKQNFHQSFKIIITEIIFDFNLIFTGMF